MPIIRRNKCFYATLGTCCSVWMTVWCSGFPPCIPDSHPYRITSTKLSHKHSCFSWWWAHSRPKHVDTDQYTKNKFVHQVGFLYKIFLWSRYLEHRVLFFTTTITSPYSPTLQWPSWSKGTVRCMWVWLTAWVSLNGHAHILYIITERGRQLVTQARLKMKEA